MFDKYIYNILNFVYHWSTKLTSWSWCKLYSDRKKGYGYRKKHNDKESNMTKKEWNEQRDWVFSFIGTIIYKKRVLH